MIIKNEDIVEIKQSEKIFNLESSSAAIESKSQTFKALQVVPTLKSSECDILWYLSADSNNPSCLLSNSARSAGWGSKCLLSPLPRVSHIKVSLFKQVSKSI